jgi:hypothetical protein
MEFLQEVFGLDIFFLSFTSGPSMNSARSFASTLVSGVICDLCLYWSATFIGISINALIFRRKICFRFNKNDKPAILS